MKNSVGESISFLNFFWSVLELKAMQFEESVSNYTTLNLFHDINSLVVLNFRHFTHKTAHFCSKKNWIPQTNGLMTMKGV